MLVQGGVQLYCPDCGNMLSYSHPLEPWHDEHLVCVECNGTYNLFEFKVKSVDCPCECHISGKLILHDHACCFEGKILVSTEE